MRAVMKALGVGVLLAAAAASTAAVTGATNTPARAASTTSTATMAHVAAAAGPASFYYGTDSWPVSGAGGAPYHEPVIGGYYGGYIGMAGNWARTEGCSTGNFLAWSSANATEANYNYTKHDIGIGTGVYWYMGGPGVDPHWNGTAAEASKWGAQQAAWALAAMKKLPVTYPVVWADIEEPGIAPAPDNGWNIHYTSPCSGVVAAYHTPASVDRAEFNGFATYITSHSKYKVGVYSSAPIWTNIFGTGTASQIPNTYEWTYLPETSNLSAAPPGWCLRGTSTCAQFFGGQTSSSKYALAWQWSGGGGVTNGIGDFDQINDARLK
jgi:hypothetical protein